MSVSQILGANFNETSFFYITIHKQKRLRLSIGGRTTMRHGINFRKFSRTPAHRKMMFRNLTTQLIKHGRIVTTIHKAKDLRRFAERVVTITKRPLHSHHLMGQLNRRLTEPKVAEKALLTFPLQFQDRRGGYTRIIPLYLRRKGDNAKMAIIEYIDAEKVPSQEQVNAWKKLLNERNVLLDKIRSNQINTDNVEGKTKKEKERTLIMDLMEAQKRFEKLELVDQE